MANFTEFYDVDYDSVKARLKVYLASKTALSDYNFEGSAISTWLNIISYAIVYINSILNFVGNELFISTATINENVLRSANLLNYLPRRKSAPVITLSVVNAHTSDVTIPAKTRFNMGDITLSTIETKTATASATTLIEAYEGEWVDKTHTFDGDDFETITLDDKEDVDWTNFSVTVDGTVWTSVYDNQNTYGAQNYFIKYIDKFQIKFDKMVGGFFDVPDVGDEIVVSYLKTNGALYNGNTYAQAITIVDAFSNSDKLTVSTTDTLADGLDEEESASIALNAPLFFSAAGRCVNENDYNSKIKDLPLYHAMADMTVYSSHKDYVTIEYEFPTNLTDTTTKMNKGYFNFSGLRRALDDDWAQTYTFMTDSEIEDVIEFFDPFKFIQVFGKYKYPNVVFFKPIISIKFLSNFSVDTDEFEEAIHDYLDENHMGFNKSFSVSSLIAFLKSFDYVDYCTVTYETSGIFGVGTHVIIVDDVSSFTVGEEITVTEGVIQWYHGIIKEKDVSLNKLILTPTTTSQTAISLAVGATVTEDSGAGSSTLVSADIYHHIRLNSAVTPSSISGSYFSDNGSGNIIKTSGGAKIGEIVYDEGYIRITNPYPSGNSKHTFITDTYEFELVDDSIFTVEKETFMDHIKAEVTYL